MLKEVEFVVVSVMYSDRLNPNQQQHNAFWGSKAIIFIWNRKEFSKARYNVRDKPDYYSYEESSPYEPHRKLIYRIFSLEQNRTCNVFEALKIW